MRKHTQIWFIILLFLIPGLSYAALGLPAINVETNAAGNDSYSVSLQVLAVMTALAFIPAFLIMMTSFTRIIIVMAILRQAIGMAQTPTNQILTGLALFLTFFVMAPVFEKVNATALQPYLEEKINFESAIEKAQKPLAAFMLNQTRETDLNLFLKMANKEDSVKSLDKVPFSVLVPAFVTSELKTAFQIGFLLFLPFLIIDLVISSVLMSMGMMMLSPLIVSLPFKIMLFVLVDGWALVMGSLASSFSV